MDQSVVAGIDRSLTNVIGLLVLIADMLVRQLEGLLADPGGNPLLEVADEGEGNPQKKTFRDDAIGWSQIAPMAGPIDLIETLGKQFATYLPQTSVEGGLPAATIKVGHGEINHADVPGNVDGLQRKPLGQEIKFRRNRTDTRPIVQIENGEDKLSPSRRLDRGPHAMNPIPHPDQFATIGFFPQQAESGIGDGAGEDRPADRFFVQTDGSIGELGF